MSEPIDDETASQLFAIGAATMREVYQDRVPVLPEGALPFNDVMMRTLFSQVWTRPALEMRERRLLLLGVIAAMGESATFVIQARAALDRGELTPEQLRESLIMLAPYAGYPRVAALLVPVEEVIRDWEQEAGGSSSSRPDTA